MSKNGEEEQRKRERERKREGDRERGREGERSQARSILSVEPNMGLDPTTLGSWPEPKPRVGYLTSRAPRAPQDFLPF